MFGSCRLEAVALCKGTDRVCPRSARMDFGHGKRNEGHAKRNEVFVACRPKVRRADPRNSRSRSGHRSRRSEESTDAAQRVSGLMLSELREKRLRNVASSLGHPSSEFSGFCAARKSGLTQVVICSFFTLGREGRLRRLSLVSLFCPAPHIASNLMLAFVCRRRTVAALPAKPLRRR